ncbi:thioesterase family protein [Myceligenerans cantabricum]
MRLHIPISLRWSDLDAYQHVNNVEMLDLLQEARIEAFWRHEDVVDPLPTAVVDSGPSATTHTFVAHQEIEYLRPLEYTRRPVLVEMWFGKFGGASIEVCYAVHEGGATPASAGSGEALRTAPYARASTTLVLVAAATGKPRRLTPEERAAWEPYLDDPVKFRRR